MFLGAVAIFDPSVPLGDAPIPGVRSVLFADPLLSMHPSEWFLLYMEWSRSASATQDGWKTMPLEMLDHPMHFAGIVNMYVEIAALIPRPKCTRKYNNPCLTRLTAPDLISSSSDFLVTVLAGTFGLGEPASGNTAIEEFVQHGKGSASVVGYEEVNDDDADGAETGEEEGSLDAPFGSGVGAQQVR